MGLLNAAPSSPLANFIREIVRLYAKLPYRVRRRKGLIIFNRGGNSPPQSMNGFNALPLARNLPRLRFELRGTLM